MDEKQLPKEVYGAISKLLQFLEKSEEQYIETAGATASRPNTVGATALGRPNQEEDKNENS